MRYKFMRSALDLHNSHCTEKCCFTVSRNLKLIVAGHLTKKTGHCYRQIASYQRGVGRPMMVGIMDQQNTLNSKIGVHSTMHLMHPNIIIKVLQLLYIYYKINASANAHIPSAHTW